MGRVCAVKSCFNSSSKYFSKSFFKFPIDINTCSIWVKFCQSPELETTFANSGPAGLQRKKMCSDHFCSEDLRDPGRPDKGLRIGAIPRTIPTVESVSESVSKEADFMCICPVSPFGSHDDQTKNDSTHFCDVQYLEEGILGVDDDGCGEIPEFSRQEAEIAPLDVIVANNHHHQHQSEQVLDVEEIPNLETFAGEVDQSCNAPFGNMNGTELSFTLGHVIKDTLEKPDPLTYAGKCTLQKGNSDFLEDSTSALKTQIRSEKKAYDMLKESMKLLKKQLRYSERKWKRKDLALKKERAKVRKLNTKLKQIRTETLKDRRLLKALKCNPVLYNSLFNASKKPKGRRYNREFRKFATSSYLCGPKAYRMIRNSKALCLPAKRTIKRWTKEIRIGPGINKTILQKLKMKSNQFTELDRVVIVAIDGMKIKSSLSYTAKNDTFHGFPDTGQTQKLEKNDPQHLASEAVTVMIRGVFNKFKQALGYFLTHNTLGSETQMDIIIEVIRRVREAGFNPMVLVMDQFATNMKMAKDAGATIESPFFSVDGKKIYVMWDSPHLIKNARNMLKKCNAVFGDQIASFNDIEQLYKIDSVSSLRLAPRLTEKHIKLPPFSPMNVSMAARTLSQSVAAALRYYSNSNELPQRVEQTAEFIVMHDMLFDTFNGRQKSCPVKMFKGALQENSCHWAFLESAKTTLSHLYFTKNTCFDISKAADESKNLTVRQRYPNYVKGFINNINAVKLLWNDLTTEYNCEYLCANHLSQDCLENLFSEIRRRCGSNDTPDALQFGAAFKYAIVEKNSSLVDGSNCEQDLAQPLLDDNDDEFCTHEEKKIQYKKVPLDLRTPLEIPVKELNVLTYILGASVRKLIHQKCVKQLTVEGNDTILDDEMYNFCKIKQAAAGRNYNLPSNNLYAIGILCFAAFKQYFRKFLFQNHQGVKARLKQCIEYDIFKDVVCNRCYELLLDIIFNTLIQGFLKQVKAVQTENKAKNFKRNRKARRMCLPLKSTEDTISSTERK